jgi:hypothetical protein
VRSCSQVSLKNIDHYATPNDGVWHPDALWPRMAWKGTGTSMDGQTGNRWRNPWVIAQHVDLVDAYTEVLEHSELNWAMPLYGSNSLTEATRGNLAVARQDLRPAWLSQAAFLAFGNMRSGAFLQHRKLCVALKERSLPLGEVDVQRLVRQTLYHCGQLTDEQTPALLWRTEWEQGDILETLGQVRCITYARIMQGARHVMSSLERT